MTPTSKLLPSQASGSVFPVADSGSEVSATRCATPCVSDDSGKREAAKHWPGPWSAGSHSIEDANGRRVVDIDGGPPMIYANARLIAAAPDMLAALQKARVAVATWSQDPTEPLEEIEAAIAKATGAA